ncbi:biotin--acetyl-CoA-carboxylase ligase [Bathymodiolus azoricus thioautotrophic gill symbiont]|jgi:BirA family biotin operon repressor/biotin-[acetyl-CoA-carboxylase] ligase|uniref:Biotin--acetyl-CoA-carboxylase ligase n=4 Tax=sulfur-oxidizing symbionts TaxID=32036 RepID=A0A1H6JRF0_9GAMM|nr:biotin--acetyl-CoA-carboxylase ligase [Bathymodiolus azoricus thioautotrophic gill symbiont]
MAFFGFGAYNMDNYSNISAHLNGDIDCHIFDSIPSTNDYLSSLEFSPRTQVCIASEQTQGKGQYNRTWLSNKDNSVLLSIRCVFSTKVNLSGLSLVVGLALLEVLRGYGAIGLELKWPNDIYYQDKKLAGILIKNTTRNQTQSVVIGIGVNIGVDIDCQTLWTDLHSISTQKSINQFDLTKDLINKILEFCQVFEANGFTTFSKQWASVDYLQGKRVRYDDKKQTFLGVCCGVNDEGVLLVETKASTKQVYSSEFLTLL